MKIKLRRNKRNKKIRREISDNNVGRSPNFSYHSSRSSHDTVVGRSTSSDKARKLHSIFNKLVHNTLGILAILVVVVSISYALTLNQDPKIEIIGKTSTSFLQPVSVYQSAVIKLLKGSFLNRDKITINTASLQRKLSSEFPELSEVSIVIPLLSHQPLIEIRPAQSTVILANKQGKFLINSQGNAIIPITTQYELDKFNLPVITDESGLQVTLGKQILSSTSIAFINTLELQFIAKSIPIQSMTLSTIPYELDVQARGEPYYIKFDLLNNVNYEIGTYLATIKLLGNTKPSQYIDVRIPGRAYYK